MKLFETKFGTQDIWSAFVCNFRSIAYSEVQKLSVYKLFAFAKTFRIFLQFVFGLGSKTFRILQKLSRFFEIPFLASGQKLSGLFFFLVKVKNFLCLQTGNHNKSDKNSQVSVKKYRFRDLFL